MEAHRKTRGGKRNSCGAGQKPSEVPDALDWRLGMTNLEWVCNLPQEAGFLKPTAPNMRGKSPASSTKLYQKHI